MVNKKSTSYKAIEYVKNYERKEGREVKDVQNDRKYNGLDLISKNGAVRKIEVKGTTKEKFFPGFLGTEFTNNKKLKATHLYVVHIKNNKYALYIIPRSKIKTKWVKKVPTYRITSSEAKKELLSEKYKVK